MTLAFGIDPGGYSGLQQCRMADGVEFLEPCSRVRGAGLPLPSVVLTTERGSSLLEAEYPLLPIGTGSAWPPESQVSIECGSRRIPLALALASLRTDERHWAWPTFGVGEGPKRETRSLALLVREGMEHRSRQLRGTIAMPIPGLLPIEVQTELSSRRIRSEGAAEGVRLLWRSMAASIGLLGAWNGSKQVGAQGFRPGSALLHVHMGVDGFEASVISIQEPEGQNGPRLLVPARKRPVIAGEHVAAGGITACHDAKIGMRLLLSVLRSLGVNSLPQLWETAFTSPASVVSPESQDYSHGEGERLHWASLFEPVDASRQVSEWVRLLEPVVRHAVSERAAGVILSGSFASDEGWSRERLPKLHAEMDRVLRPFQGHIKLVSSRELASGAALFASRRACGWATYLDQLPEVEIVVQKTSGPAWTHAIPPQTFYDAGKAATKRIESFGRLSAGENKLLLPALVEGFGSVRETSIEFERPTVSIQVVDLQTELEAASGLPVIRAELPGMDGRSAELNWLTSKDTGKGKQEYLDSLPQQFPPLEVRVESKWWVNGHDVRKGPRVLSSKLRVGSEYLTCDEACGRVSAETRADRLQELFQHLGDHALNFRRWGQVLRERFLEAATDSNGKNRWAVHLPAAQERAVDVLARSEYGTDLWKFAARFLAQTRHSSDRLEVRITKLLDDLRVCKEADQLLPLAGNCSFSPTLCARVLDVLGRKIDDYVEVAEQERTPAKGINTMKALSAILATRADATSKLPAEACRRLAEASTRFLALGVRFADDENGLHQRFRAGIKAVVFLLRRRAYDSSYIGESTREFERAVRSCCIAGLVSQMRQNVRGLAAAKAAINERLGLDSEAASVASKRTLSVLASLTELDLPRPLPKVNDTKELDDLVEQVVRYIEGRGAGIIAIED